MSHKRVDDFMKIVRERVTAQSTNNHLWEHMYQRLCTILGTSTERAYLENLWNVWRQEIALEKWDCDFTEMVIDEAGVLERTSKEAMRTNSIKNNGQWTSSSVSLQGQIDAVHRQQQRALQQYTPTYVLAKQKSVQQTSTDTQYVPPQSK